MLVFLDQPKNVKVLRVNDVDGKMERTRVGVIVKNSLELTPEMRSLLSEPELDEVNNVVDFYKRASSTTTAYYVAKFPEIVREVVSYYESGADETERRLIMASMMEGLRRIRRQDRTEHAAD